MYDYGMVKSIHDQRMRQFIIEAERSHLIRQLRKNRPELDGLGKRMTQLIGESFQAVGASIRARRWSV